MIEYYIERQLKDAGRCEETDEALCGTESKKTLVSRDLSDVLSPHRYK